jgi:hypothetical protein
VGGQLPSRGRILGMNRLALLAMLGIVGLAGCTAGAPQGRPEDFPIHARDQIFVLDYRIDRHPDRVEAVGLITSRTTTSFQFAALNLLGVTEEGRVVSRGSYIVNGTFGGPQSFTVGLTPTGKEVRYEFHIGNYSLGRGL